MIVLIFQGLIITFFINFKFFINLLRAANVKNEGKIKKYWPLVFK